MFRNLQIHRITHNLLGEDISYKNLKLINSMYLINICGFQTWSQYGSTYNFHTPEDALYVYECVEIDLGLFFADNDEKYNCPIHLHADKHNKSR